MKRFLMATAVACALCMTVLAGEIPSGGAPQPQSPQTTSASPLGDIPSGGSARSISGAAISALLNALGLASV